MKKYLHIEMYQDDSERHKGRAGLHHETGSYQAVSSYYAVTEVEDSWDHYQRNKNVVEDNQWLLFEELLYFCH